MSNNTELKNKLQEDMKSAMRERAQDKLSAIRLILAAVKQYEVDNREDVDDAKMLAILDKLAKQRRESIEQYNNAGRDDLVAKEQFELAIIQEYLPTQLNEKEIKQLIAEAISNAGAESVRDMGKVMAILKPKMQGRADMGEVSKQIKAMLGA